MTGNKVKGTMSEGNVKLEGGGRGKKYGSRDTDALEKLGQNIGGSGKVGGPTAYFK